MCIRDSFEGWLVEGIGPITFVDGDTFRTSPVLDVGVEWYVLFDGCVEFLDFLEACFRVDTLEAGEQLF